MTNLVSTDWLAAHLDDPDLRVLDATWHMPSAERDAHAEFIAMHIKGAQFFDIDKTSDPQSKLPHMLPSADQFAAQVGAMAVSNTSQVVAYDSYGMFSAARCWWMFKVFGHDKVFVLNGGFKKWLAENRPTQSEEAVPRNRALFTTTLNENMVRNLVQVAQSKSQIADARSPTRFRGEEAEPRSGVRAGHIPGAHNVHYAVLIASDGTMRPRQELAMRFADSGIDITKSVITSCGSGITAAILSLALTELGASNHALFDGSWTQWGSSTQPLATGEPAKLPPLNLAYYPP